MVNHTKELSLEISEITCGKQFTQTLFAKYKMDNTLNQMYESVRRGFSRYNNYELTPHLSLLYSNEITEKQKLKEAKGINLTKKIILDKIAVIVKEGDTIEKESEVLLWGVYRERKLSKKSI